MEATVKIVAKTANGKSFKDATGSWYTVADAVVPYLAKANKGETVKLVFDKKGTSKIVTKLMKVATEEPEETTARVDAEQGPKCEDCGKALKDAKYTKCYECNKKAPASKTTSSEGRTAYGSPEDIAGKQAGCALGAAASVAAGQQFSDVQAAAEWVKELATELLDWMRTIQ